MKKQYVQPVITIEEINKTNLICTSGDIESSVGIGYGGVDEGGSVRVDCRRRSIWDDEED